MFVPLLHNTTRRNLRSFIQSSTERKNETKLPDLFADCMRRLHSSLTIAVAVLSEFVQPLILCGPGYLLSHLDNLEPNLNEVLFTKWHLYSHWDKNPQSNKGTFYSFYYHSTMYSIWNYYQKMPKRCFILFISFFYNRVQVCLDCYSLFKMHVHNLRQSSSVL